MYLHAGCLDYAAANTLQLLVQLWHTVPLLLKTVHNAFFGHHELHSHTMNSPQQSQALLRLEAIATAKAYKFKAFRALSAAAYAELIYRQACCSHAQAGATGISCSSQAGKTASHDVSQTCHCRHTTKPAA